MSAELRQDVQSILEFVADDLYLNRPDLENAEREYNATLLMSVLTALIVGEPGFGKTTSAEYVGSLLYRIPLGTVWEAEVSGHPEQTEEKIVGRPDLGELNQRNEDVVWSGFAVLPIKIVDEINRLPEIGIYGRSRRRVQNALPLLRRRNRIGVRRIQVV